LTKTPSDRDSTPTQADLALATGAPIEEPAPPTIQLRLGQVLQGLRYVDISQMTGVHPETVRRYLTKTSPSIEFVSAVAQHQGVSLDWLLLGRGPQRTIDVARVHLASAPLTELIAMVEQRLERLKSGVPADSAALATPLRRIAVLIRAATIAAGGSPPPEL
jgi:hypothetical protein